jgi:hypothetical protein
MTHVNSLILHLALIAAFGTPVLAQEASGLPARGSILNATRS